MSKIPTMTTEISKGRRITGWVLNGLVAAALFMSAIGKISGAEQMQEVMGETGIGDYLVLLGTIEILCVLLFVIPKSRSIGALAIIAYLGGVISFEWSQTSAPFAGILLSVLFWVGLYLREPGRFR